MRSTPALMRMASTHHGMRRILKRPIPTDQFIRQAIQTGVYLGEDEDRSRLKMRNRRQQYPVEYQIITLNPPIPDPPRIPKKYLRQEQAAMKKTQADRLVQSYLNKKDVFNEMDRTADDYYRKLLGISAPAPTTMMGQKSALLNKAYAVAIKQEQVMRSGVSEEASLAIVEELLREEAQQERVHSRKVQTKVQDWKHKKKAVAIADDDFPAFVEEDAPTQEEDTQSVPSVLHSKPRTIQGMSIWSKKLQAIPYQEWTIGACVALDHFVAVAILDVSEDTWDALLEGSDHSLKSIGRDIVMTRRAIFPETALEEMEDDDEQQLDDDDDEDSKESSIDDLLASLSGFDNDEVEKFTWKNNESDPDTKIDALVNELQDWRTKQMETDFKMWSDQDKKEFTVWLKTYVETLQGDDSMESIDWTATREALLSVPPTTREESNQFWDSIRDEGQAEIFLQDLEEQKEGESLAPFWNLTHAEQVERLAAIGTMRPLLDEYANKQQRLKFLDRHADKLLEGLELEHIVMDPKGPITSADLQNMSTMRGMEGDRFSIQKLPYGSNEKGRLLFAEWNRHKAGRARYEEHMFKEGKLGLRYSDEIKKDEEDDIM